MTLDPRQSESVCTCSVEGFDPACPWARGGIGHVKECPAGRGPCPCLPGSISEAYCATEESKQQQIPQHHEARIAELSEQLAAMTAARDLAKRQTAQIEELRQWQVSHARVALQAIAVHGRSAVWDGSDCAIQADAAMERMDSPVDSVSDGMRDA